MSGIEPGFSVALSYSEVNRHSCCSSPARRPLVFDVVARPRMLAPPRTLFAIRCPSQCVRFAGKAVLGLSWVHPERVSELSMSSAGAQIGRGEFVGLVRERATLLILAFGGVGEAAGGTGYRISKWRIHMGGNATSRPCFVE